jgi:ketosteroid isomerase-like protein
MHATLKTSVAAIMLASASLCSVPALAQGQPNYLAEYRISVADDLAIRQIIARLNQSLDAADYKAYGSHFSSDAIFVTTFGNAIGPEKIMAAMEQSRPFITGKRHVATNLVISGSGNKAIVTSYLTVYERVTSLAYLGSAVNIDTLEKRGGKWQVVKHETEMDPATLAAIKAAMGGEKK